MRYEGTEKLGRAMPLQGVRYEERAGRPVQVVEHVVLRPGQVVETPFDLGSWVALGYVRELPEVEPVVVAEPEPEPVPEVLPDPSPAVEPPVATEEMPREDAAPEPEAVVPKRRRR